VPASRASVPPGDQRARGRASDRAEPAVRPPSLRSSPQPSSSHMPPVATQTDDSAPSSASADGKRPLGRRHSSSMTSRRYVCEGSRLLRPVLGQLRGPGSRQILVSVAVASIDEEVGARAGARRVGGAGRSREAAESPCAVRPNAVQLALPDDGRFRQAPSRVFRRRSSTGGHRLGISHSPPTRRRSGPPPRDRRVPPPAPDGHLRVRLAGQQRIPGHAPLRVELARRRAPHGVALSNPPSGAAARRAAAAHAGNRATGRLRPHDRPPASAGSPRAGARSIPGTGRLSQAPTHGEGPPPTGATP
jgi:hypothetical protein